MHDIVERLNAALADHYRIESRLGEGGMATVYLAEDHKHDRKVAVKVLKPELAAILGADRFVREIKTTASLQHPNILPLYDSGEADGFLYYVMPYVEGESLREKLNREKQLGIDEAVAITTDVARALDFAHRHNVIHRDIKPENILLHDGRPIIADFGIALAVSAAAGGRMTETGLSLGTPHYMSPEQATAERDLTGRSDVYSLGAVLYEMLAGDPPHIGGTAQQIIMKIVTEPADPITKTRKSVPPNVAAAVTKALEKLAADRFATADEFSRALNDPTFTVETAPGPFSPAAADRLRAPLVVVGVVAVVAIIVAVIGSVRPNRPAEAPVTRLTLDLHEPARGQNSWGPTVMLAPDGSSIVYHGTDGRWWLRSMNSLSATHIPDVSGQNVAFSPDGRAVVFRRGGWLGRVFVKTLSGDRLEPVADSAGTFLHWGPDGWIYYQTFDRGLARVPETGGQPERLTQVDTAAGEFGHGHPYLIPGVNALLIDVSHTDPEDRRIDVLDLDDRSRVTLMRGMMPQYVETGHLVFVRDDLTLMAVPFDPRSLSPSGPAVEVVMGLNRTRAASAYSWHPDLSISSTGALLYVTQDAEAGDDLVWVDRSGRVEAIDSSLGGRLGDPRLSMDGSRLALQVYRPGSNIWVKDLRAGSLTRLTFGFLDRFPHWFAEDSRISFVGPRPPRQLAWDFYTVASDGGADSLVFDVPNEIREAFWSPDGMWLVYQEEIADLGDLRTVRQDALDVPIALTSTELFDESQPELSPDGRWLAYQSNESGRWEIWVMPFPDPKGLKTQISFDGGREPVWSRSGGDLFYVNGAGDLMAADVSTGVRFAVRSRRPLFKVDDYRWWAGYDVTADDQGFILIRGTGQAAGRVVLVQNFVAELRRLAPN